MGTVLEEAPLASWGVRNEMMRLSCLHLIEVLYRRAC